MQMLIVQDQREQEWVIFWFYEISDFSLFTFLTKFIHDFPVWCFEFIKSREEDIAGWQLSWIFTLLHTLNKTDQVGCTNTYAKTKPFLAKRDLRFSRRRIWRWLCRVLLTHRLDDGGIRHLWNVCKFIPDYTAQQPRRHPSSSLAF
jgi:hypothetical protein